ncbi:MAG: putative sulfate exporter family transporter, partial [Alphaproteobacteria bacterium]
VKLIRVSVLAPVVLIFSLVIRATSEAGDSGTKRPPLVPGFILAFLILAGVNSLGVIPQTLAEGLGQLSRWTLLVAIAAVGMKTSLRRILDVGGQAITLIVAETVFIAGLILIGIVFLA